MGWYSAVWSVNLFVSCIVILARLDTIVNSSKPFFFCFNKVVSVCIYPETCTAIYAGQTENVFFCDRAKFSYNFSLGVPTISAEYLVDDRFLGLLNWWRMMNIICIWQLINRIESFDVFMAWNPWKYLIL